MLIPGLVSVTFRKKSIFEIAELMRRSGLSAVEWGGDVHINSAADPETLETALTAASSVSSDGRIYPVSFGSYYRCEKGWTTEPCVTRSIDAPNIRVWAGTRSSADADEFYRGVVTEHIQALCDEMKAYGVTVSTEFHGGTLTDHYESAVRLVDEVGRDNFYTYWQPNQFRDEDYNVAALKAVLPYLSNVHVFTWDAKNRYPLSDGEKRWRNYVDIIASDGLTHHMLLEFVKDDSDEQFLRDSETLRKWLE